MAAELLTDIFRRGSRTYYHSALFFPEGVRRDVQTLYAFVRSADDLVDRPDQDRAGLLAMRQGWQEARAGRNRGEPVIDLYAELADRRGFAPEWTEAFFRSMELDTFKGTYADLPELMEYIYGSAEVVGLMMGRILSLPPAADGPARALGRAMQYVNFIRDLKEDHGLGRTYFPRTELDRFGLGALTESDARRNPDGYRSFIREQLERCWQWQDEAEAGYRFITRRYLVPVKTAADMYLWTAKTIARDPFLVFSRKIRPSRLRVLGRGLANALNWRLGR